MSNFRNRVGAHSWRGKYTGNWTDNMSTGVMMSSGDYDAATKTYTFRAEMPDMMKPGATIPIRETLRVVDADHHVMEMFEPRDGKEVKTMMLEYSRAKYDASAADRIVSIQSAAMNGDTSAGTA